MQVYLSCITLTSQDRGGFHVSLLNTRCGWTLLRFTYYKMWDDGVSVHNR